MKLIEILTFERFKPACECVHITPDGAPHPCPLPGMVLCMYDHEPLFLCRPDVERIKGRDNAYTY